MEKKSQRGGGGLFYFGGPRALLGQRPPHSRGPRQEKATPFPFSRMAGSTSSLSLLITVVFLFAATSFSTTVTASSTPLKTRSTDSLAVGASVFLETVIEFSLEDQKAVELMYGASSNTKNYQQSLSAYKEKTGKRNLAKYLRKAVFNYLDNHPRLDITNTAGSELLKEENIAVRIRDTKDSFTKARTAIEETDPVFSNSDLADNTNIVNSLKQSKFEAVITVQLTPRKAAYEKQSGSDNYSATALALTGAYRIEQTGNAGSATTFAGDAGVGVAASVISQLFDADFAAATGDFQPGIHHYLGPVLVAESAVASGTTSQTLFASTSFKVVKNKVRPLPQIRAAFNLNSGTSTAIAGVGSGVSRALQQEVVGKYTNLVLDPTVHISAYAVDKDSQKVDEEGQKTPCAYEPGSAVPGKWELYMYKHGQAPENNGWRDMRYGQNPNGLNSLCPHPTSGNAKMAEATFDQKCYEEVLAVGGTGAWVRLKRKDDGCIPASHAFGPGEHSINGQYSIVATSSGFSGDAKIGPVNHGPLFSDALGGGQWMWRCNTNPPDNCQTYDTGGVLGNSFSDPNTWGNLITMPGMYDAGKGEANCCNKGYSWAWYGKTVRGTGPVMKLSVVSNADKELDFLTNYLLLQKQGREYFRDFILDKNKNSYSLSTWFDSTGLTAASLPLAPAGKRRRYVETEITLTVTDKPSAASAYTEVLTASGQKGLCAQSTITNGNPTHLPDVRGWIDNDPSPHA
ncbi:unnamed protein product, partial [Amoebophrya sp. A120]|eukprot:GSA120T00010170001.1